MQPVSPPAPFIGRSVCRIPSVPFQAIGVGQAGHLQMTHETGYVRKARDGSWRLANRRRGRRTTDLVMAGR